MRGCSPLSTDTPQGQAEHHISKIACKLRAELLFTAIITEDPYAVTIRKFTMIRCNHIIIFPDLTQRQVLVSCRPAFTIGETGRGACACFSQCRISRCPCLPPQCLRSRPVSPDNILVLGLRSICGNRRPELETQGTTSVCPLDAHRKHIDVASQNVSRLFTSRSFANDLERDHYQIAVH